MTAFGVGLVLGLGLFCIWWAFWEREEVPAGPRPLGPMDRLNDEIAQAGYTALTPGNIVTASAVAGLGVLAVVFGATRTLPVALCFAAMAAYAPLAVVRMRARSRRASLRDLWPDVVDNIASAVRAGMALPESLIQLSVRGPEELRPAFAAFAQDYRTSGRFQESLDLLKVRLADPVADRIVESLRIAREVGGSDLGRLPAAPWLVLAMMSTRAESIRAYNSPGGVLVLGIGAGVSILAYRIMVRIGRLPEEERVLR